MTKWMGVMRFWSFQVCTCRRSMHPWDTLILLVSIAVCSCDSSNFPFDVECFLTSASARSPNVQHMWIFLLKTFFLLSNKLLVNHIWTSIPNEVSSGEKMQSKVWWEVGTWYFTLKMEKCSCYVLPHNVSSSLPVGKNCHAQNQYQEIWSGHQRYQNSNYRRVFLSIFNLPLNKKI